MAPPSTTERVLSWLSFVAMLVGIFVLLVFSVFSVFATDACGSTPEADKQKICDSDYFSALLLGFWGVIGIVAIGTLVLMIVGQMRDKRIWPYPFTGWIVLVLATAGYVFALFQ